MTLLDRPTHPRCEAPFIAAPKVRSPDLCAEAPGLIGIDAACALACGHALAIAETEAVPLRAARGRTLAETVRAEFDVPRFDQAAMDGYAIALGALMLPPGSRLPCSGRIAAGDAAGALRPGTATRILTGAPMPAAGDAVLMQEHAHREGSFLVPHRILRVGDNIRRRGEDVSAGEVLLRPGGRLDARQIALLAAQGRASLRVVRRLRIGIVSAGNELRQPGARLDDAAVFDSNRPMLTALAEEAGADIVDGGCLPDDPIRIGAALAELATVCDLIVGSGGASAGEEDHAAAAITLAGGSAETLRIALKPGKPAVVGRIGTCAYLGLPGNPVSALVSWLLLGTRMLAALEGRAASRPAGFPMRVAEAFERRPGRTEFVPVRLLDDADGPCIAILGRGGSARLRPLAFADGLAEIEPLHAPVEAGSQVRFHPFGSGFAS